jgi:predicted ABC-type ATPase
MPPDQPVAIVLGGVNGAGKSTAARAMIAEQLAVTTFVNADEIARGLNAFAPEAVAFTAGRVMLARLRELAEQQADFGFETTRAGRTYLPFLRDLRRSGYAVELYYLWLRTPELAVNRVRARVRRGGHNIPETTIKQRYRRSLHNFWRSYRPEADFWFVYDNSEDDPVLLAIGSRDENPMVADERRWRDFAEAVENA